MISPRSEVVITGLGVVSPIGVGYQAMRKALHAGTSGVRRLSAFDTPDFPVRIGAEVSEFDAKQYVTPRKSLKVMSRGIQLAFAAAHMAVNEAGVGSSGIETDRFGVVFGADMMQLDPEELIAAFQSCINDNEFEYRRWNEQAFRELYPLWMLKYLPNMPACHMAISLDARGPNNTLVLGEVSSLAAIAEAVRVIERGDADMMISGGTGSRIHPLSWCFRDNVLHSCRHDEPQRVSRPFDAERDGMVYGEGAAAFLLESRQHAEARGAKILARITGFASCFETCTPGAPFEGRAIRAAIEQSLRAAQLEPADIGHVNAHGLSTVEHDRAEALAIRDVLGDVPVTALKSFFGNLGAGTGAVEMIGSLMALETGDIPFTLNYDQPDPDCPVNVVRGVPERTNRQAALLLNQTSNGQSLAVVVCGPN